MRTAIIICALALAGCGELRQDTSVAQFNVPDSIGVYGFAAYASGMGYTNCVRQSRHGEVWAVCFDREGGL